jgi:hypothetical protein
MSEGITYSSYQLDDFQICPRLWDLKQRWEEPDGPTGVYLVLGAAVASGLCLVRRGRPMEEAEQAAKKVLEQRADELGEEWTEEGVLKHILAALKIGVTTNLGLKTILSADQKKYGHCRPDIVGRTHNGRLRVIDDKVKLRLDPKYIDETLSEFKHSNQLYEYAWEVGRYYNEHVDSVGVNLIICTPRLRAVFYPFDLSPTAIEQWASSAQMDFDEMAAIEAGQVLPRLRWKSCTTRYNKPGTTEKALCPMHPMCHDLYGDEALGDMFFNRR